MNPIEKLINPKFSRDVLKLLRRRGWSDTKVARTIHRDVKFVAVVGDAQASFSMPHLNAIARSSGCSVDLLIFEVMEPIGLKSAARESFRSMRDIIVNTGTRKNATAVRRAPRKRGSRTKAA